MSLFSGPDEHAANPPESWQVVKAGDRSWHVRTADGATLDRATTRRAADELTRSGHVFTLWHDERRWYAGESVRGWKPWAVCRAEQERTAAAQAARAARQFVGATVEG